MQYKPMYSQALDAGRVYTVFPVEGTPPNAGIVRRDR